MWCYSYYREAVKIMGNVYFRKNKNVEENIYVGILNSGKYSTRIYYTCRDLKIKNSKWYYMTMK